MPNESHQSKAKTTDKINPPHYQGDAFECIDVIKFVLQGLDKLDLGEETPHISFCLGNAIKYLFKSPSKNDFTGDIEKAIWYLQEIIKTINNEK